MNKIFFIMGVSGCGKSTIGESLAKKLDIPFFDGDDFHPEANISKMKNGEALNDDDRLPWLKILADLAQSNLQKKGAVIATSALKKWYRDLLEQDIAAQVEWVFLKGEFETILQRIKSRDAHFMPAKLLQSQFDALEEPSQAIKISVLLSPEQIIDRILNNFNMELSQFGVIGMGVMGKSLSLNLAENGFSLSLFNRYEKGVEEHIASDFINSEPLLQHAKGFEDLAAFTQSLARPRKILFMIKAGIAIDYVIEQMTPHLDPGDILIDGGNSHYKDTARRQELLDKKQIHYIGSGISGGEEGARRGPSIMPGGLKEAYLQIKPFFDAIAAKDKNGNPCCDYIGDLGSGHFVKMVHNGIEYAEMQLIAEAYGLLRFEKQWNPEQIAALFESWLNDGLSSYLLEITASILKTKEGDHWLIDSILDKAGNKGTGSWTTIAASNYGVPVTMIAAALFARYTSSFKNDRVVNSQYFSLKDNSSNITIETDALQNAYQLARIINHHQGFHLISAASSFYGWELDLASIARIWTNGCIIRSSLMESLSQSFLKEQTLLNIPELKPLIEKLQPDLYKIASQSILSSQSCPCLTAAADYLKTYTSEQSTANIIQAQRDYFGAHTFERVDDPSGKKYHHQW